MTLAFQRRLRASRDARTAAVAAGATGRLVNVPTPEQANLVGTLMKGVRAIEDVEREVNTSKAIDTKKEEWMQYCDLEFPGDPYRYNVTATKAYPFMCYQMFREEKRRGGNKALLKKNIFFDHDDYKRVTGSFVLTGGVITNFPVPQKPVGMSVFTQYRAALKELFHEQQGVGALSSVWELVWLPHFKALQEHVKYRKQKVKRANYEEKIDSEFAPYAIVEHYPSIEQMLWDSLEPGARSVCCSLRHRFCAQYLTSGILRSESAYNAELSDFQGTFVTGNENDVHPIFVMIMTIPFGKTNKGCVRYGRAIRHKDVRLCCVGGLSFYLQYRFFITREFEDFTVEDWLTNQTWFDIKLLVDCYAPDKTKKMQNDSYSDKLKQILGALGLSSNKLLHLGRNLGAKILDLLEELKEEKRNMGQWSPDVVDKSHSSKLPLKPMRKLAGYTSAHPMYYNKRTVVRPDEDLIQLTPVGKWCYNAFFAVSDAVKQLPKTEGRKGQTALGFLKFVCYMNQVFLEDAAAMLSLHPDRAEHPMFKEIPVFRTEKFKAYQQKMAKELREDKSPLDANLEKVLPGLHQWQLINHQAVENLRTSVRELKEEMFTLLSDITKNAREDRKRSKEELASVLRALADLLIGSNSNRKDVNVDPGMSSLIQKSLDALMAPKPVAGDDSESPAGDEMDSTDDSCSVQGQPVQQDLFGARNDVSIPMVAKHTTLQALWNEWHGLDEFKDSHGGIIGRENVHKSKWRKGVVNAQHFSRTKRVVEGIKKYAMTKRLLLGDALLQLQVVYETDCKSSIAKLVKVFQGWGTLDVREPRFKKNKENNNNNTTTTAQ